MLRCLLDDGLCGMKRRGHGRHAMANQALICGLGNCLEMVVQQGVLAFKGVPFSYAISVVLCTMLEGFAFFAPILINKVAEFTAILPFKRPKTSWMSLNNDFLKKD